MRSETTPQSVPTEKPNFSKLFDPRWMKLELAAANKWQAIEELAILLVKSGRVTSLKAFVESVRARERLVTTGLGNGVGIPHGISESVVHPVVAFGRSHAGIDFEAVDGLPVRLVFLLAVPARYSNKQYLELLSSLARLLVYEDFREKLFTAASPQEVITTIQAGILSLST